MPKRLHVSGEGNLTVPYRARFIDNVECINAQKGGRSNWPHEDFQHKFTYRNEMYRVRGRKSGKLIYDRLQCIEGKRKIMRFSSGRVYGLKNGNVFISSSKGNYLIVGERPLWDMFEYPD